MLNICRVNCRLTVVFLAFDLFFILFCIGMACVVFFSLCCCIPIIAFAYAMTAREGASEEVIRALPKYTFRQAALGAFIHGKEREPIGATTELDNDHLIKELALHPEDSVSYLSFYVKLSIYISYIVDCYNSIASLFSPGERSLWMATPKFIVFCFCSRLISVEFEFLSLERSMNFIKRVNLG